MTDSLNSLTLLGSSGGLAKAVLALLNKAIADPDDPLHPILNQSLLHLIDMNQRPSEYYSNLFPNLFPRIRLLELNLQDLQAFKQHLADTDSRLVIDVSWADTLDMLACCDETGTAYVNTALENAAVDADASLYGFPLTERYERFEDKRSEFTRLKAIVCSGMNPGVVQWMAYALQRENPDRQPIACYIVEQDTSFYTDPHLIEPKTIYASWSVECFLDESILSYPMFVRERLPHYWREEVYSADYKVQLGDRQFYGCLMPHEEVLTLGALRDWEVGFIYCVNDYTTGLIRNQVAIDNVDELWEWEQRIIEPLHGEVGGEDRVGVLFVYENEEKYIYNVMSSREVYPVYGTNATYFQVACGVYAATASLLLDPVPNGVLYVDEWLEICATNRYGEYLSRYMTDFVSGTNPKSDGLLLQRRREV